MKSSDKLLRLPARWKLPWAPFSEIAMRQRFWIAPSTPRITFGNVVYRSDWCERGKRGRRTHAANGDSQHDPNPEYGMSQFTACLFFPSRRWCLL